MEKKLFFRINYSIQSFLFNKNLTINYLIPFVVLLFFISCSNKNSNVIITGKVNNSSDDRILYPILYNETYNSWFRDTAYTESNGEFNISGHIQSPCFLTLGHNGLYELFIIEPNEKYVINIESKSIEFVSEKSEIQSFYDQLPKTDPRGSEFLRKNAINYDSIIQRQDLNFENEIKELDKLKCSIDVYNLVKKDREVYYAFAKAVTSSMISLRYSRTNDTTPEKVFKIWEQATADVFSDNREINKATYYYELLQYSLWYKIYTNEDISEFSKIRQEKRDQKLIHSNTIEFAQKYLPKERIEFYTATYIQECARQNKFETELISLFEKYNSHYPKSRYIGFIQPNIKKIEDFYVKTAGDFNDSCKIIENYKDINTLSEALLSLKGKKVYVDIWTTSCGSCKKDFAHNEKLKATLKNKGIEMLYISLDSKKYEDRWMNMIKYYNLSGFHIRANEKLNADLGGVFGISGVPHYLIIDEDGNIKNRNAASPSNMSKLLTQLNN